MSNKYKKYFIEDEEKEWHNYKVGTYHISAVGNSHKELSPQEHYGPCLRSTFWNYKDPAERDEKSIGNLRMGNILHGIAQEIYKKNRPNSIIEFPIVIKMGEITIKGSVDIIDFGDKAVVDLKTASLFTFPSSEYDYNQTYLTQVRLYGAFLQYNIFDNEYFEIETLRIVYIKKHNLETLEMDINYDGEEIAKAYADFVERVQYLHDCLTDTIVPKAEPHKWCKFCPYLEYCLEHEDLKPYVDSKGKKKKGWYVLNEKQ